MHPRLATASRSIAALFVSAAFGILSAHAETYSVSPSGNDANPGTAAQPFATLARAQVAARGKAGKEAVTVTLRGGTYYLPETFVLTAQDSGTRQFPVTYQAAAGEAPVLSGGVKLSLKWEPYRDGIMKAAVPADLATDQLFVNGERQPLARYPNYDPKAEYFGGYAADAFSPQRAARWADPQGGFMHAMHNAMWGGFSYVITGKDAQGHLTYEGGWQNNRKAPMHDRYRFVENIFEELDAPGEWFLDRKAALLYFYPPAGLDLPAATIEAVRLKQLVEFRGTEEQPVRFLSFKGLTFRRSARTFMENKEPLLRSDWTIYRGGAIFFNGAEDCALEDCFVDQAGGNAVFINNYNRRITVRGCHIANAGANGVAFVGDPLAVRSPLFEYGQSQSLAQIDRAPGPKTNNYPADCLVDDCLIERAGRVEKQCAPVEIEMSRGITIRHCSIYDTPRAGINIGSGCWGGHLIEFCDVFDTVKETGDHGSFNSWGRDRWWNLKGANPQTLTLGADRDLPRLDAVQPTILRNNRWRCDHGWDIDLDDGTTNYEIRNNLCLHGGIKNREGFYRIVENNIMVNNSFHPHVWFADCQDVVRHNIVFGPYRPAVMKPGSQQPWGEEMDFNLLHQAGAAGTDPATALQQLSGRDAHSIVADAGFIDPAHGDYRVKAGSPALALGFQNFPMDQFGVQRPALKALARTPDVSDFSKSADHAKPKRDPQIQAWLGAKVRNIVGQGEMSAYGTPGETGVLVLEVPADGPLARAGLQKDDVILGVAGKKIETAGELLARSKDAPPGRAVKLKVLRQQKQIALEFTPAN